MRRAHRSSRSASGRRYPIGEKLRRRAREKRAGGTGLLLKLLKTALKRGRPLAHLNTLAAEHYRRGELDRAEQYFREVALQSPSELTAWTNLAATLLKQQRHAAALPVLLRVIELEPGLAAAHLDLGTCYNRLRQNTEAIRHYERAIALDPELHSAHANVVNAYLDCCDWDAVDRWAADFVAYKNTHAAHLWAERLQPFCALTLFPGKIARELAIYRSQQIARSIEGALGHTQDSRAPSHPKSRIRIGYVSSDFYAHATAHLTFSLYAAHDRREFEIVAYSMGPDDKSLYRKHIEQTCDRFVDVRFETEDSTARRIKADEIDILVDVKGYTSDNRLQIFAYRPAPVQVSYLGYPGTSGAAFMDYFISDPVATPPGYEEEFTEKIVYLPDSYQVNDSRQPISVEPVARSDFQLPEQAFVYCSFNRPRKIDRTIFSTWMEILRKVPNSILWLLEEDAHAEENLRKEAASRNIDPERLIFSPQADKPAHLARHRLADLFLDTYNYNAHTGASDALWAGLPVLTCPGGTFATRVAASLLHAAGLPELIARDLNEYQEIAVRLAESREALTRVKSRLEQQRLTCPLFDTPRYVRHLEAAYRRMYEISRNGGAPRSFPVARSS